MIKLSSITKLDKMAKLNIALAFSFLAITIASNVVSQIKSAPVVVAASEAPALDQSKKAVVQKQKKRSIANTPQADKR